MLKYLKWIFILVIVFILGMLAERAYHKYNPAGASKAQQKKPLYWVAPMDPNFRRDKPGKSPMGMDLVPVYEKPNSTAHQVKISSAMQQNLGIKFTYVKKRALSQDIHSVATIVPDENLITHLHVYTEGWIKHLNVKTTGERVRKGQTLFLLYSLPLINAQEEYLLARKMSDARLRHAAKNKLLALGMSNKQISALKSTQKSMQLVHFDAPQSGIISMLNVRRGMFVKPNTNILTIENLSRVWLRIEIIESQAHLVQQGDPVSINFSHYPSRNWSGQIEYIYPHLEPKQRALIARVTLDNTNNLLKPNMYADVIIHARRAAPQLSIPKAAVIHAADGPRVIIAEKNNAFSVRKVQLGMESKQYVAIQSGLKAGEKVVLSGQFLIDSEASLQASFTRIEKQQPTKHNKAVFAAGSITEIDAKNQRLKIKHAPIAKLGWPEMTMYFKYSKDVSIKNLNVGDSIHFKIKKINDRYVITFIHVMSHAAHD